MKKVTVSVINDLVTDQRVHKVCETLTAMGFDVTLVGRKQAKSLPLADRNYRTKRMKLLFEKGVLFYAFFQLRLFLYLLFHNQDLLVSNDLDTLWPNSIISRWKKIPLVYDSHEIFTEVPELVSRPSKQNIWRKLEARLFPKLRYVFTVNDSIAAWFEKRYGIRPLVVRNMPRFSKPYEHVMTREQLNLPSQGKIVLLQGAGINIDRGAEELVDAMRLVENVTLVIVGSGDVIPLLKKRVQERQLESRVIFTGKVPHEKLRAYTAIADLGVTLDKPTNINYKFSLPNKIFDYIHAGVPVLASELPEVAAIVRNYKVGIVIPSVTPEAVANGIHEAFASTEYQTWKANALKAASSLCWESEEEVLKSVYSQFL